MSSMFSIVTHCIFSIKNCFHFKKWLHLNPTELLNIDIFVQSLLSSQCM